MPTQIRAVYVISVAAELAGVHPQTLRIYERKGLLDPARTAGRQPPLQRRRHRPLRRIQELTDEGLNLAGVKRVLELEAERRRSCEAELRRARPRPPRPSAAAHRQYRRDLVPVRQAVVALRGRRRRDRARAGP